MKKGWLIYDEEGADRNQWFIAECLRYAEAFGLDLQLKMVGDTQAGEEEMPDFALVRTIDPALSRALEAQGVTVLNGAELSFLANDKWETYRFASSLGLPVMETLLSAEGTDGSLLGYPVVVKSRNGHGGKEVFRLENEADYRAFWQSHDPKRFITQALCSETGRDMRVYVLGGEIFAAVLRWSENDFRSNFSLGGKVVSVAVPRAVRRVVKKLCKRVRLEFVGVDFIRHEGKWILNEIEDVVGSRMLYQTTGIDVARAYLAQIAKTVGKRV